MPENAVLSVLPACWTPPGAGLCCFCVGVGDLDDLGFRATWLGHNAITEYLDRVNAPFVRLNLLLLLVISFVPFPTRLFADFIGEDSPERVAVTIYGITLLLASTLLLVLWRYALGTGLVRPDAADEEIQLLTQRLTPA